MLKKIVYGIIGAFVLIAVLSSFTTVSAGERGVVLSWGAFNGNVLEPGLHWLVPFRDSVRKVDVTVLKQEDKVMAATKDLQDVSSTIAVNHHIDTSKVGELYVSSQGEYEVRFVIPGIQETVKAATAKYTAEELITKRAEVREVVRSLITEKLSPHHILVDDVNIINFNFSSSFSTAIEAKVTAEQTALAAKNKLEQVKFEADQRVAQAKAEAEAIRIQAQAIQNQGGESYVNLKAIEKWDGKLPIQFVPGSALPFLNLQ